MDKISLLDKVTKSGEALGRGAAKAVQGTGTAGKTVGRSFVALGSLGAAFGHGVKQGWKYQMHQPKVITAEQQDHEIKQMGESRIIIC